MRILVTGAGGFIGSHLTERLVKEGHEVTALDISQGNIDRNLEKVQCQKICADINDITRTPLPFFDAVFHLAAIADIVPSIKDPTKYHNTNVTGTVAVLEMAKKWKVKKFIYAASGSCYGDKPTIPTQETEPMNPKYPYALTKMIGEQYALHYGKVYGFPVISLRLFNVYGPRSRTTGAYGAVFGVFLAQKLNGRPYTVVGDGSQSRDFTYVSDAVEAFVAALKSDISGEVYNIGSGTHSSIRNLVNLLGDTYGTDYIPDRPAEPKITLAWTQKARKDLGFQTAVEFAKGVKIMLENIQYWKDAPVWDKKLIAGETKEWFETLGGKDAGQLR